MNVSQAEQTASQCNETESEWELKLKFHVAVVGAGLAALGTLCNILVLITFAQFGNKKPSVLFLIALAFFDILVLECYHLVYSIQFIATFVVDVASYEVWASYVPYVFPFSRVAQACTIYIVIFTAVERCVTLTQYRLSQRLFTHRNVLWMLLGIFVGSYLFNLSRHWEVSYQLNQNCTGLQRHRVEGSALIRHEVYQKVYSFWATSIVTIIAPFITLVILVSINFYQFHRAMNEKMLEAMYRSAVEVASRTRQLKDTTMVMLVLVVTYLCFNTLGMSVAMWEFFDRESLHSLYPQFYALAVQLINICAIMNSGFRIVNYFIFNHEFRSGVIHLCCPCKEHRDTIRNIVKEAFPNPPIPVTVAHYTNNAANHKVELHCECSFVADGEFTEPIYV